MPHLNRRHALAVVGAALATMHTDAGYAQAQAPAAAPAAAPQGPFKLPPLPYAADKNAPTIDAETMSLHHDKHHAAYVNNLNAALAGYPDLASKPLHELLGRLDAVPEAIRATVRNNGGGHANHSMFWQVMGGKGGEPKGELKAAIDRDLGGLAKLQEAFNTAGGKVFGSGWVFVTVTPEGALALVSRPNQDTPLMEGGRVLFGNDVWEHAYYLTYRNRRPDYLKAWWNVVDWGKVADRYAEAKSGKLTT